MLKKFLYNTYIVVNFLICYLPIINSVANKINVYNNGITTQDIINGDVFFEIIDPIDLEYTYRIKPAKDFGGSFSNKEFKMLNVPMVITLPLEACDDIKNKNDLNGNIALVNRGVCSFQEKTINVERVGARAIIITDINSKDDGTYIEMIRDNITVDANIPAGFLIGPNGRMIVHTLTNLDRNYALINIPVNLTFTPPELINHPPWSEW